MVFEWFSPLKLTEIEPVLRRAAVRHAASLSSVERTGAAIIFTIQQPALYAKLLAAEIRFAALLPCRVAAYEQGSGVKMAVVSPIEFARAFHRADLDALAENLENLFRDILQEASHAVAIESGHVGHGESAQGATEDQMSMSGTVGQRIDSHGSKVEELAGTGEQDSLGG